MSNRNKAIKATLLAAVALIPAHGFAQDADTTLTPIVLTGNWLDQPNEEKVLNHAGARTIIERKAFEERGAQDIRDALNQIPGVQVQGATVPAAATCR